MCSTKKKKKKLYATILVLLLKISFKIPKLHRGRGIKCKLRTSKSGVGSDENWMFVDREFCTKILFRHWIWSFLLFCLFTFCSFKVFLLISMLSKRENHNFKKPKPPTPKFYRPTLPTPATNPCYLRLPRYLADWFSPYI